jgi:Holliday junction resolvase
MTFLMYFASFGSVLVFFASAIGGTLWVLTKFILAWGRFFRALMPKRRKYVPVDLQPHHLKRAGQ